MDNTKYFYISGFISISLFSIFALLMFFTIFSSSKLNIYALKKDNYISVSVVMPKKLKKKVKTHTKKRVVSKPKNDVIEPKDVSIDDLFSDVWTKSIKKVKKKTLNKKRLLEIQKKSKLVDKDKTEPVAEENVKEDEALDTKEQTQQNSTANEINKYRAKIQALVYENFYPPANSVGEMVVAYIKINAIGKVLDFRILKYSSNGELNKECDKIKSRLMGILFPLNPENKTFSIKINLIPEDK